MKLKLKAIKEEKRSKTSDEVDNVLKELSNLEQSIHPPKEFNECPKETKEKTQYTFSLPPNVKEYINNNNCLTNTKILAEDNVTLTNETVSNNTIKEKCFENNTDTVVETNEFEKEIFCSKCQTTLNCEKGSELKIGVKRKIEETITEECNKEINEENEEYEDFSKKRKISELNEVKGACIKDDDNDKTNCDIENINKAENHEPNLKEDSKDLNPVSVTEGNDHNNSRNNSDKPEGCEKLTTDNGNDNILNQFSEEQNKQNIVIVTPVGKNTEEKDVPKNDIDICENSTVQVIKYDESFFLKPKILQNVEKNDESKVDNIEIHTNNPNNLLAQINGPLKNDDQYFNVDWTFNNNNAIKITKDKRNETDASTQTEYNVNFDNIKEINICTKLVKESPITVQPNNLPVISSYQNAIPNLPRQIEETAMDIDEFEIKRENIIKSVVSDHCMDSTPTNKMFSFGVSSFGINTKVESARIQLTNTIQSNIFQNNIKPTLQQTYTPPKTTMPNLQFNLGTTVNEKDLAHKNRRIIKARRRHN